MPRSSWSLRFSAKQNSAIKPVDSFKHEAQLVGRVARRKRVQGHAHTGTAEAPRALRIADPANVRPTVVKDRPPDHVRAYATRALGFGLGRPGTKFQKFQPAIAAKSPSAARSSGHRSAVAPRAYQWVCPGRDSSPSRPERDAARPGGGSQDRNHDDRHARKTTPDHDGTSEVKENRGSSSDGAVDRATTTRSIHSVVSAWPLRGVASPQQPDFDGTLRAEHEHGSDELRHERLERCPNRFLSNRAPRDGHLALRKGRLSRHCFTSAARLLPFRRGRGQSPNRDRVCRRLLVIALPSEAGDVGKE